MSEALTERRLVAIVLGNVVGYSRLMGVDEIGTMTTLKGHRQDLVLPALASTRARLIDSPGDSMLMEFGSAVSAVSCAVSIQRGMLARNAAVPTERQLRFRLGIHLGDIVVDVDKIFGDGINVAARLESLCEPDGICLSQSVYEQVRGRLPYPFVDIGEQNLKNIAHPVQVFRLAAEFIATLPYASPSSPPVVVQTNLKHGTILNDTYQIDALLGSGGMGEIFRGHEIYSGGDVAIKVIRPDMINNRVAASLFQKEALILKELSHDAVVRYYSFSFDSNVQRHYLAMEFLDGSSLPDFLKLGPLSLEAVSALRRRIASGLHVAHERGVIHRDVSSDNIIVPERNVGRAKIIDFGIARADIGDATIISNGFAGKYKYASPEQLGLAGGEITRQSDIYSFGLVLAEASAGEPLDMGGTQAEVLDKRRRVPNLDSVDPRLHALLEAMLQPDPRRRPATMQEVADWPLGHLSGPAPTPLVSPSPASTSSIALRSPPVRVAATEAPKRAMRRWVLGSALGVVLVGTGAIALDAWLATRQRSPHPAVITLAPHAPKPGEYGSKAPAHEERPALPDTASQLPGETPADHPNPVNTPQSHDADRPSVSAADRISNFVASYRGDGCFLARAVRVTADSAAIDSFALDKTAFRDFDAAFSHEFGFSPDIVGNRIWSKQCPALDFLRHAGAEHGRGPPTLFVRSTRVGRGQSLAGEVHGSAKEFALLLVQDDGVVIDLSNALKNDGAARTFEFTVSRASASSPLPQMLITIGSSQRLDASNQDGQQPATRLFQAILDEAKTKGAALSAGVKLFLITP